MAEGKIEIPPPIGLLDTDSYSAKANRVTMVWEISIDPLVLSPPRRGSRAWRVLA